MLRDKRKIEYAIAVGSFVSANCIAYAAFLISPAHDIAAGVLTFIAQLLLLCATIFGVDYKFNQK